MSTSNKELQEKRIKGYFIEATKKLLRGEGLKSISVRNVAKEAGYSYATLYNYFADINDLIFECVKDFQIECEEFISDETKNADPGIIKLKAIAISFIKYFVQYPGIFELFFLERMNDMGYNNPATSLINNFFDNLCEDEWAYISQQNIYSKNEIQTKKILLRNSLIGMLLLYINRRFPAEYKSFVELTNANINGLFN